ncbi:protein piccolo-like [Larimichthys crocea]|uniref:protein piccolo-like n=1 Tax=Larimichthys crocea TaxID=215358 RepID=UPI000F5D97D7|nr:protein piccolo-like [Larimichthys crocea]
MASKPKPHRAKGENEWISRLRRFAASGVWPSETGNRPAPLQKKWHDLYLKIEKCPKQMRGQMSVFGGAKSCGCGFHAEKPSSSLPASGHPGPSYTVAQQPGLSSAETLHPGPSYTVAQQPGPSSAETLQPGPSYTVAQQPGPSSAETLQPGPSPADSLVMWRVIRFLGNSPTPGQNS